MVGMMITRPLRTSRSRLSQMTRGSPGHVARHPASRLVQQIDALLCRFKGRGRVALDQEHVKTLLQLVRQRIVESQQEQAAKNKAFVEARLLIEEKEKERLCQLRLLAGRLRRGQGEEVTAVVAANERLIAQKRRFLGWTQQEIDRLEKDLKLLQEVKRRLEHLLGGEGDDETAEKTEEEGSEEVLVRF